ncbi:type II secretion system F family protein [Candidatus Contubernalis alkaliaceticus]|uniref:type II secretion system F family protein n=1 Tax=Candidatus Contubernalis alkaliaceticus TaxID=338645 RepID=UPI001F4BF0AA|nr:type II secretion system F family protein [Candidatus Contubernalis alkalaceticus]UNC93450.1 type II secretion system F family protein [Candidatus Contubernalis alkalaceticus]
MHGFVLLLVFGTTVLFSILLLNIIFKKRIQVSHRLAAIKSMEGGPQEQEETDFEETFFQRVVQPGFQKAGSILGSFAPREMLSSIEKRIVHAGITENFNVNNLLIFTVVSALLFVSMSFLIFTRILSMPGNRTLVVTLGASLFGLYFPMMILNSKAAQRQKEIQKALPEMLDLLLVSVEAGLGFDMALKRVVDKMPGELTKEFSRCLEEIRRGKKREDAFRGIIDRTGVQDLSIFITSVIQSEQLGTNIANTLRIQADSMRRKRRQRAEESAMKAPIKMLFPMIFFILPTLFIVILGPAVINLMQMFQDMF